MACLGSAIGASPWVASQGPAFVYISTAASISVGLAALLNAKTFAILFALASVSQCCLKLAIGVPPRYASIVNACETTIEGKVCIQEA